MNVHCRSPHEDTYTAADQKKTKKQRSVINYERYVYDCCVMYYVEYSEELSTGYVVRSAGNNCERDRVQMDSWKCKDEDLGGGCMSPGAQASAFSE